MPDTPSSQTLNDTDAAANTPDEVGGPEAIQYPEGFPGSDWLIAKTKHLNKGHEEWFSRELLGIQDNYKLYEVRPNAGGTTPGTIIPIVTSVVDTMTSRTVSSLAPRDKFIDAVGLDPETQLSMDGVDKQEQISDFINETLTNVPDFADKIDEVVKTLFLENVTVLEAKWSIEKKMDYAIQRSADPMMAGEGPVISKTPTEYEMERPDMVPHSIRMCAWDPRCKDKLSKSPFFRIRNMDSINGLFALQEEGVIQDVEEITKKTNKAMTPENPTDPDAKQSQAVEAKQLPAIGWDDGVWEVDRWWADIAWKKPDGTWQRGKYEFWIVGGDTVVKFRPNVLLPQRTPVITVKGSRKPGQLMAQGPVNVIKSMQKTLDTNVGNLEQLIKNAAYSPTFYEPSSGIDGRRTSLQTNAMIAVLNVKGIQRFEPAVSAIKEIENYIQFIIAQMRESTAANDQAQGIDQAGGNGTATEAQILAQGSNNRFNYIIETINAGIFPDLAHEFLWLWKQFGKEGQMIVKDGSNDGAGYQIKPEDLAGCYAFRPVQTQSQQAKLQHMSQLKGILQDMLAMEAQTPNKMVNSKGVRKEVDALDFITNNILPLAGVQSRGLFKDAPPPPPPMGMPGMPMGAMPPAGGPAPIPESVPVPEPASIAEAIA